VRGESRELTLANVGGTDVRFRGVGEEGRGRRIEAGGSTHLRTSAGVEAQTQGGQVEGAELPLSVVEFVESLG
jgi:hypothetical protein